MAESSCGNRDTQAGNNSVPKSSSSNSLRLTPSQALRRGNSSAGGSGSGNGNGSGNRNSSNSNSSSENNGGSNPNASNNGNNNNNNNNRRRRNNRNSNSNSKNDQNGPSPPSGEGGETNEKRQQQQQQQQQQRQRQRGNNKKGGTPNVSGGDTDANASSSQNNDDNNNNNNNPGENKGKKQRQRQRPKPRGKKGGGNGNGNGNGNSNSNTEASVSGDEKGNAQPPAKPKKSRNRNNNNNKKKKNNNNKYPWRRHIPEGTVDPITLEELDTLEYPPFALVADEPYIPVREWPIPPGSDKAVKTDAAAKKTQPRNPGDDNDNDNDAEDQNRQRLADQWGEFMLPSKETSKGATATTATTKQQQQQQQQQQSNGPPLSERPLNLFDGRALAFYMVSQLQFIDPFTRRDLTRPELVNLDRYLDRYGSGNLNNRRNNNNNNNNSNKKQARAKNLRVTDAYDAKGITLSSAGAAAATARGRADILQQTAQQLLDSLFAGPQQQRQQQQQQQRQQESTSTSLQEQYASLQRQERAAAARHERRFEREPFGGGSGFGADARGGGGGGGGFVVIDDDENPELRGRGHDDFPTLGALPGASGAPAPFSSSSSSSLYSASHIAGQRGRGGGNLSTQGPGAFPSLPTPASASTVASASALPGTAAAGARTAPNHDSSLSLSSSSKKPPSKPSKTLSKISGIVKKTTAEEKQRQWEAREMARRKAMMSNLTLGANHSLAAVDPSLPRAPTASVSAAAPVTDEQIQRNRAFAEALGVKPATQRHYASGWARPTTAASSTLSGDEHADELEAALYPDELVLQARDTRMPFLLKLEKRWKTFLNDDAAASLPLNRMDRASRKFVHHYAEFWNLKTESFDPEPNRYIHCVKLPETRMPLPLLSEVARNWRGPAALPLPDATRTIASFLNISDTNNGGNIHDHNSQQTAGQSSGSGLREVATKPLPMLRSATALSSSKGDLVAFGRAAAPTNSRSDALRDKERPRMTLLPRSVPLELPPLGEQTKKEATLDIEKDLAKRRALLEEKRQREKELEQKKRRALEDAFASDDDDDEVGRNKTARGSDDDSDWGDDQEPLYDGSDEE